MTKNHDVSTGRPLLDIASYARRGPNAEPLTPSQLEQIRRTARRVPEVVVKVLPRGSNDLKAAGKHLDYIGRHGELELEGDNGDLFLGTVGKALLEDWDLDIDEARPQAGLAGSTVDRAPKLVHKLMFSMPPGTPPDKVLKAVRNFAREQFALQHRYAFVLHTDEPHPHVHLVLKAVSEQGVRLNIKKATLRHWRSEFARELRLLGVAANATERQVRGSQHQDRKAGIYRSMARGDSTFQMQRNLVISRQGPTYAGIERQVRAQLLNSQREVELGWRAVAVLAERQGQSALANDVRNFADGLPIVRADLETVLPANRGRLPGEGGPTR